MRAWRRDTFRSVSRIVLPSLRPMVISSRIRGTTVVFPSSSWMTSLYIGRRSPYYVSDPLLRPQPAARRLVGGLELIVLCKLFKNSGIVSGGCASTGDIRLAVERFVGRPGGDD